MPHDCLGAGPPADTDALSLPTCAAKQTYEKYYVDNAGNRTSLRTRKGETIGYAYNEANRLYSKTPAGQGAVSTGYTLAGDVLQITKAAYGGNPQHLTAYGFDAAGRRSSETNDGRLVGYQYNEAGGRTRTTWPDGYYVAYGFDALNRMSSATENGSVALASYTLDALSRRSLLRMGGVATNQTGYTYESDSDLDVLTQTLNGTTVTLDHGHNRSHQLTGIAANDDFYLVRPATVASRTYAPNALNEYGSFAGNAVTNDLNGNLTSWFPPDGSGKQTYTYDSENRLTSAAINGSSTATIFYDYDGLGRRASKTVSGVATTYLLDGDEEIAEYNGSTLLRRYVTGPTIDDRIARAEGSGTSDPTKTYYHTNHQGSVIAITSPAGTVSQRLAYDEYGNLTSGAVTTGEQFRYTGRRFDAETGLYYYRARYYSPALGRFLQVDPIGYGDDNNLYAYVGNDPIDVADPSGACPWCLIGAAAGTIVSVGVQYATTGTLDIQQVGIAAAAGFVTGGASSAIAASVALTGARVAANAAVGAAVGATQAAASHAAATWAAPSVEAVAKGAALGAATTGAGAAVGEAIAGTMAGAAGRLVSAPANATAAAKSLAATVNRDTLSAASPSQIATAKAGPVAGSAAGQAVQSALEAGAGVNQVKYSGQRACTQSGSQCL